MQERKLIYGNIFFAVSFIGVLFVLMEIILQSFGKSVCFTEGCKIVAQQARFGDLSILLIGLALFFSLALLSGLKRYRARTTVERFINILLIVSLAAEGYFTGYQVFAVKTACLFCLVVFGLIVVLGLIRLLAGTQELTAGFAACAAVFSLWFLVLPAQSTTALPANERFVLFYSKDCKYCAEVRTELDRNKITVKHVEVNEYSGVLKSIGIESVPTLVVNDNYQKLFLVGEESIKRYLIACTQETTVAAKPMKKKNPQKDGVMNQLTIIDPQNIFTGPAITQPGGLCKEDQVCK
jgi:hypothetical protein